jgi:hypothetical protein
LAGPVQAQTKGDPALDAILPEKAPSRAELVQMLDRALPRSIGADNGKLVASMLDAELGKPLSETFDPSRAIGKLFAGQRPSFGPDCKAGADGECTAASGKIDGDGAYWELSFSNRPEDGEIAFIARPPARDLTPKDILPVEMDDGEALERAMDLLGNVFGLPLAEISLIPDKAVRGLVLGWTEPDLGVHEQVQVAKLVALPRTLRVPGVGPVAAPGYAKVLLDDGKDGTPVNQVSIQEWQDLKPHHAAQPDNAKSRGELIDEMADDILIGDPGQVSDIIGQLQFIAIPDQDHALMVPAVRIAIVPLPDEEIERKPGEATPAGSAIEIRDYQLVRLAETFGDDEG